MKRCLPALVCSLIILSSMKLIAQTAADYPHGKVLEHVTFHSEALGDERDYTIYLPPDYETSKRWYPVVYLLHGFSDDDDGWVRFGRINVTMNRLIAEDKIPPMIIVMPDGKISWYVNSIDGKENFEDMIVKDLITHVDNTYRTLTDRMNRGIAGLSMGGYGSLQLAMRNPDVFSIVGAYSSGLKTDEEMITMDDERYMRTFHNMYGENLKGSDRLSAHWKQYNPLDLAKTLSLDTLKKIKLLVVCGDDDFLIAGNQELNNIFRQRKIPHEYRIYDGAHTWPFWREHIVEALLMMGQQFGR